MKRETKSPLSNCVTLFRFVLPHTNLDPRKELLPQSLGLPHASHLPQSFKLPLSSNLPHRIGLPRSTRLPQGFGSSHLVFWALGILVLLLTLVPLSFSQPAATPLSAELNVRSAAGLKSIESLEYRVFELVNLERTRSGRKQLIWMGRAAIVARSHSIDMAKFNYFGHADQGGSRISDRSELLGLTEWRSLGENIAWSTGSGDPIKSTVESWMRSAGHRGNILDPGFRESGVGVAISTTGKLYFTQVFVRR